MIREVVDDFLAPDVGEDGALRVASVGGDDVPEADRPSWIGSKLGESRILPLCIGAPRSWLSVFEVSTLL
jgi:hypothetical protein